MNEEHLNQFRRHLARINGIKMNEDSKYHVPDPHIDAADAAYQKRIRDAQRDRLASPFKISSGLTPKKADKIKEEQIDEVEKPTTNMSFNDDHISKAALNLYHRMVGDSLRSGETYPRAHQIGVAMVKHVHGQFGLDHLKNHFKEMKKHAKHLSVDVNKVNEEQIDEADHHILVRVSKDGRNMTQKPVVVTAKNRDAAMAGAERHFRNKGMTVHALKYLRQRDYSPHLDGSSNVREDD